MEPQVPKVEVHCVSRESREGVPPSTSVRRLVEQGADTSQFSNSEARTAPGYFRASLQKDAPEPIDVRDKVLSLMREQRTSTLNTLGKVLLLGVSPVVVLIGIFTAIRGAGSLWLVLESLGVLIAGASARSSRLPFSLRGPLVTGALALAASASLFHFGPLLGTGLLFVATVLVAAMVLRPLQAYAMAAGLWCAVLLGTLSSFSPERFPLEGPSYLLPSDWVRLCVSSLVGLFALLHVFLRIQTELWQALEGQLSLRVRERQLVQEREKVLRAASSAQRLESLGRLAGGIAHDFNNSLVVIQCGINTLEEDLPLGEKLEVIGELNEGVERAAGTARQLLSFAKRNVEEVGSSDAKESALELERASVNLLPAHIKLRVLAEDAPRVPLSDTALEQLLLILVQNGREAIGDQAGEITIRVTRDLRSDGTMIEVQDNGAGMPQEVLERAFEPFFTTRGEQRAGMGLSTVWGMVRRQGGDLLLESEVSRGTLVSVVLPAAGPLSQTAAPVHDLPLARQPVLPVLILEDEIGVRAALRRILKHTGHAVVEAGTVDEARAACAAQRFCLLISDGVLPDGGVGHFIQDFRAQQNAPVILCSGYLEEDLALEGVARGQCSFLPKPFTAEELDSLVTRLLSKSS